MASKFKSLCSVVCAAVALTSTPQATAVGNPNARPSGDDGYPKGMIGKIAAGRTLFQKRCTRCHSDSGDGVGPDARKMDLSPPSFLTEKFRSSFGRREIFTSIALGKLGTHMPTWLKQIDDQDVADISEYVYQRFIAPDSN